MKLTLEQQVILDDAPQRNLLVSARAGAAKSTTLRHVASIAHGGSMLLAFNRKVADEAKRTFPSTCQVYTLNGIGHYALVRAGFRPKVKRDKCFQILKALNYKGKDFAEVLRAINLSKQMGYVNGLDISRMSRTQFYDTLDTQHSVEARNIIDAATVMSWKQAQAGTIDFDDQILVPTLMRLAFPQTPHLLIDEAQDLSLINCAMVKLIAGFGTRVTAVGDEAQAIYGFRGADSEAMERLASMFNMHRRTLTTTFRCSKAVVEEANWRTQDMRPCSTALPGAVYDAERLDLHNIPDGTAFLCRNNAPLLRTALFMLKQGYAPNLLGNDILQSTIKDMRKLFRPSMNESEKLQAVDSWEEAKAKVWKNQSVVQDRADCMRLFLPGNAIQKAQELMNAPGGRTILSTIHKAKGAEYQHTVLLDRHLIKTGEMQEDNVLYVGQTRSRDTLTYVKSARVFDARAAAR